MHFFSHHKSGTTWLGWLLNDICQANGMSFFRSHLGYETPCPTADISFLTNSQYSAVHNDLRAASIHVIRNPLSILSSAYHSHFRTHPDDSWPELALQRKVLGRVSIEQGMLLTLAFLESSHFYRKTPGPLHGMKFWNYDDRRIRTLRMEDIVVEVDSLLDDIADGTQRPLQRPSGRQYEFEQFTGRKPGAVDLDSHYRSGSPDAWRTELPPAAIDYVRTHYRDLLTRFYPAAMEN